MNRFVGFCIPSHPKIPSEIIHERAPGISPFLELLRLNDEFCAGGTEAVGMNGGSGHHRRAQTQGGGPSRGQSLSRRESLMDRLKRVASQPALAIPQVSIPIYHTLILGRTCENASIRDFKTSEREFYD